MVTTTLIRPLLIEREGLNVIPCNLTASQKLALTHLYFLMILKTPKTRNKFVLCNNFGNDFCTLINWTLVFSSVKLQLQATSVGEVVIKGVCANRYLAMNRDGRLFGTVRF